MAATSQTTFSNGFSWIKIFESWLKKAIIWTNDGLYMRHSSSIS